LQQNFTYTLCSSSSFIVSLSLIRRTACACAQFSGCSSTTNAHIETGQMAVCCQNLTLGALSSRSALSMLVGALFKKFDLFLNRPRILFANDTSILFTHSDTTELNSNTYTILETVNTWFKNNYISLNFGKKKPHSVHFKTRNSPAIDMKIDYNNKLIPSVLSTKFLRLTILCTLSWRMHINHQLH